MIFSSTLAQSYEEISTIERINHEALSLKYLFINNIQKYKIKNPIEYQEIECNGIEIGKDTYVVAGCTDCFNITLNDTYKDLKLSLSIQFGGSQPFLDIQVNTYLRLIYYMQPSVLILHTYQMLVHDPTPSTIVIVESLLRKCQDLIGMRFIGHGVVKTRICLCDYFR